MDDQNDKLVAEPRGWHSRGYLPHFDGGPVWQFMTLHLGDALPKKVVDRWKLELQHEEDEVAKIVLFQRVQKYLDQGYGKCYLRDANVAENVQRSLLKFDGLQYRLTAWVIMPNHTHFLFKPLEGYELSDLMQAHKSVTAHECNKLLSRSGQFWQEDYFDRYIRDGKHYMDVVAYIENNPVKARLCKKPSDWIWSSAYFRAHCINDEK